MNKDICITCPTQTNGSIPIALTIMVDSLQNPIENNDMNVCDVDQLRLYIIHRKECYEIFWSHPIMFKGSIDLKKNLRDGYI